MLRTMEDVNSKMDLLDLMTDMLNVCFIVYHHIPRCLLLVVVLLFLWEMMLLQNTMPFAAPWLHFLLLPLSSNQLVKPNLLTLISSLTSSVTDLLRLKPLSVLIGLLKLPPSTHAPQATPNLLSMPLGRLIGWVSFLEACCCLLMQSKKWKSKKQKTWDGLVMDSISATKPKLR